MQKTFTAIRISITALFTTFIVTSIFFDKGTKGTSTTTITYKEFIRSIGEGKVSIKTLEDSAINKLRKQQEETSELEDLPNEHGDDFHTTYKGEISKSGTAILPSKRIRRIPEKANFNIKTTDEKNIKATDEKNDDESKKQVEPETSSTETKIEE